MFKKFISLITAFILVLSVGKLIFAADDPNAGKIRLGSFILVGLETNLEDNTNPEWFKEYYRGYQEWQSNGHPSEKIAVYTKEHPLYVTPEQAEQITILFSDDLIPLKFTAKEWSEVFVDFAGIESLRNLQSIGTVDSNNKNGINDYPFSKEQISGYTDSDGKTLTGYYKPLVEAFRKVNAKELWPHLNFDTLRPWDPHYSYDNELRKLTKEKLGDKVNQIKKKIQDAAIDVEEKQKLINDLEAKLEVKNKALDILPAYDLSTSDFESDFEKKAVKEFEKIEETLKLMNVDVNLSSHLEILLSSVDDSYYNYISQKDKLLTLPLENISYDIDEYLDYTGLLQEKNYIAYAYLKKLNKNGNLETVAVLQKDFVALETNGSVHFTFSSVRLEKNTKYVIHDYIIPDNDESLNRNDTSFRLAIEDVGIPVSPEEADTILQQSSIKYKHETSENDLSQSLQLVPSIIETKVVDGDKIADGTKPLEVNVKTDKIIDRVVYKNLIPTFNYKIKGVILDYDSLGKLQDEEKQNFNPFIAPAIDEDSQLYNKLVLASSDDIPFAAADDGSGSIEIVFNNLKLAENKRYVIVEYISSAKTFTPDPSILANEIPHEVYHLDTEDLHQTFVTTGQNTEITDSKPGKPVINNDPTLLLKPVPIPIEPVNQKDKVPNTDASYISKYVLSVILLGSITVTSILRKHKVHH